MFTVTNLIGIAAGGFVILAFYARDERVLRQYAITSNVLFMIYALLVWLWPIFLLHAILLPLNLIRLAQIDPRGALGRDAARTP